MDTSVLVPVYAFDVPHVAIALETGCDAFLTFDKDQAKLAKAAGLLIIA